MKMNHVGIMVGNMDKAVEFYTQALGLKIVMANTKVLEERETAIGRMCIAVFGEGFNVNTSLLDFLALNHRGESEYILPKEDITEKIQKAEKMKRLKCM